MQLYKEKGFKVTFDFDIQSYNLYLLDDIGNIISEQTGIRSYKGLLTEIAIKGGFETINFTRKWPKWLHVIDNNSWMLEWLKPPLPSMKFASDWKEVLRTVEMRRDFELQGGLVQLRLWKSKGVWHLGQKIDDRYTFRIPAKAGEHKGVTIGQIRNFIQLNYGVKR